MKFMNTREFDPVFLHEKRDLPNPIEILQTMQTQDEDDSTPFLPFIYTNQSIYKPEKELALLA